MYDPCPEADHWTQVHTGNHGLATYVHVYNTRCVSVFPFVLLSQCIHTYMHALLNNVHVG